MPAPATLEELRSRHADLLFEAPFRGGDGTAFVYLLIEHQSGSDAIMPLRLLRYMLRIWDRLLTDQPQRKRLPPILPMVLHHSDTGWAAPVAFADLYDGSNDALEALGLRLPQFRFYLMDLSATPDGELRGTAIAQVAYLLLKHATLRAAPHGCSRGSMTPCAEMPGSRCCSRPASRRPSIAFGAMAGRKQQPSMSSHVRSCRSNGGWKAPCRASRTSPARRCADGPSTEMPNPHSYE